MLAGVETVCAGLIARLVGGNCILGAPEGVAGDMQRGAKVALQVFIVDAFLRGVSEGDRPVVQLLRGQVSKSLQHLLSSRWISKCDKRH